MMDFKNIDGLTEEQQTALTALFEEQLAGIKTKNDELLGEKKTAQQLVAERDAALEESRKLAAETKEQNLKLAGDMDGLKKHYEEQLAESTAAAQAAAAKAQEALLQRDKSTVLNKALGLVHDDYRDLVTDKLSNMLNISYNDQGEAITEFKADGQTVAKNVDEFKSWAEKQDSFKRILNGVDSSGAGARQSASGGSVKMTLTERAIHANKYPDSQI